MSVIVTLQPSTAGTSARFVRSVIEPPSLVIHDGTTTLVFTPAAIAGGLAEAAEFAAVLVRVADQWEAGCREALDAAKSGKLLMDLEALIAEYGPPQHSDGETPGA